MPNKYNCFYLLKKNHSKFQFSYLQNEVIIYLPHSIIKRIREMFVKFQAQYLASNR